MQDGRLSYYHHQGYQTGADSWAPSPAISEGWNAFKYITVSSDGVLYAVDTSGNLCWYRNTDGLRARGSR